MEARSLEALEILNALLDGAVAVDADFKILYANEAFASLCGTPLKRLLRGSKSLKEFLKLEDDFFGASSLVYDEALSERYREILYESGAASGAVQYCVQERKKEKGEPYWIIFFRDVTLEKTLNDKYKDQLDAKELVIADLQKAQSQLRQYSQDLEAMVEERTSELQQALDFQKATLNCLGQGFFVFNKSGRVLPDYSRICPELFGREPEGVHVAELLKLSPEQLKTFSSFLDTVFMDAIPFEDLLELVDLGPLPINGRTLKIDFYPMRSESQGLTGVVVVATDISKELQFEKELNEQKQLAQKVTQILRHPKQYLSFLKDSRKMLTDMTEWARSQQLLSKSEEVSRHLHTLKGGASSFYLQNLVTVVHEAEQKFEQLVGGDKSVEFGEELSKVKRSLQWASRQVEDLLHLESKADCDAIPVPKEILIQWSRALEKVPAGASIGAEIFKDYLCEPVGDLLGHLNEEVQRLGASLGKKIFPLAISGGELRVFSGAYAGVLRNLVHSLRNSVDHGIETPEERLQQGKEAYGTLEILASVDRSGSELELLLEIRDDGRGLDEEALRRKHPHGASLPQKDLWMSIFDDGLSTKDEVTTISGMGVGMSALRAEVLKLGGEVQVESHKGQGVCVTLRMPLITSLSEVVSEELRKVS